MLRLVLLLGALACARADCDACVDGRCHERRTLISGFTVTDQLAVDRTSNVLYVQLNSNLNTAFFLDELRMQLALMMPTSGMAVDQDTQTLYTKGVEKTYYKYNLASNITEAKAVEGDRRMRPDYMFYYDTLFFLDMKFYSVQLVNKTNRQIYHKTVLNKYNISDFVCAKDGKIFFVSNNTVYMYLNTAATDHANTSITAIVDGFRVLSADKHGEFYLGDPSEKVLYKWNSDTGALEVYASYQSGALEDFVFERDNRIVFRDADGSVSQWVPAPAHARCEVVPPHQGFLIKQLQNIDNQCIN